MVTYPVGLVENGDDVFEIGKVNESILDWTSGTDLTPARAPPHTVVQGAGVGLGSGEVHGA